MPSVLAERSKQDQQTEGDSDTLEVEEEILQQVYQDRPKVKKWGHPLFQTCPPQLTDTGQMRQKVKQLVSTSRDNACHLKSYTNLGVRRINRELFGKLKTYHRCKDSQYMEMQDTLHCAVTAVATMANLALEADKASELVNTKELVSHALNATTLLGNMHKKLNNKRKEPITPFLPKEIRDVCSSNREVPNLLFGDDLGKATRDTKEISKLSNDLSCGTQHPKKQGRQPEHCKKQHYPGGNYHENQKLDFHQDHQPPYREKIKA